MRFDDDVVVIGASSHAVAARRRLFRGLIHSHHGPVLLSPRVPPSGPRSAHDRAHERARCLSLPFLFSPPPVATLSCAVASSSERPALPRLRREPPCASRPQPAKDYLASPTSRVAGPLSPPPTTRLRRRACAVGERGASAVRLWRRAPREAGVVADRPPTALNDRSATRRRLASVDGRFPRFFSRLSVSVVRGGLLWYTLGAQGGDCRLCLA